jgi:hypothetical protein
MQLHVNLAGLLSQRYPLPPPLPLLAARLQTQHLTPAQAIPFLRHQFVRQELRMSEAVPVKAITFVVFE